MLLGGESQAFSFPPEIAASLGAKLAASRASTRGSLLVTPSRRTRAESLAGLGRRHQGRAAQRVGRQPARTPISPFSRFADAIVVTEDSVNMVTEAAGTGKPVYVQSLPGRSSRLSRFHRLMQERGATRPFEGRLESWSYAPINDTEMVASIIRRALGLEIKG